jgi:hypothetical protein
VLSPGLLRITDNIGDLENKALELTKTGGAMDHILAIGSAALQGARYGAYGGAAIGALAGLPGGPAGVVGGAISGGIYGGVRGGLLAGGTAAAIDLYGQGYSAMKRNNPGNLRIPGQNAFQSFATPEEGLTAAARNLARYQTKYGVNTLRGIADRWAPPNENDTGAYTRHLSEQTGFVPVQPLDLTDPSTNATILSGIVKNEQGRQPFTPEQYAQATAAALRDGGGAAGQSGGTVHVTVNAPPGTTATATHSGAWPVRLQYGLHANPANP